MTVTTSGTYQISYGVSITAGIGASIAIAVNTVVDASTSISALVATGEAILTLVAGDSINEQLIEPVKST